MIMDLTLNIPYNSRHDTYNFLVNGIFYDLFKEIAKSCEGGVEEPVVCLKLWSRIMISLYNWKVFWRTSGSSINENLVSYWEAMWSKYSTLKLYVFLRYKKSNKKIMTFVLPDVRLLVSKIFCNIHIQSLT